MNPDLQEVAAGQERGNLEGWIPALATEPEIMAVLEQAFDYRGDVTLTLKDGRVVNGYLFDRRVGAGLADSIVRVIPANERVKVSVAYSEIAALSFSGRDTAAGKSFDAWVRKYWEKKEAGETDISIRPEALD
ncbi:MAG: hypothetical protein WAM66_02410 [Acidobacteriaceae bacterium]